MKTDPLVEEARRTGEAYIQSFQGDLAAVVADLQRRTEAAWQADQAAVTALSQRPPLNRGRH